ncbi:MAG: hypothetical protein P1U57_04650 [Oleibacter sp.]|nr:hypothetical protein [Thalassolituus sp.]
MKYLIALILAFPCFSFAEGAAIDQDITRVKDAVLELNKDLYELERELLSPATTRAAFNVSLNNGKFFEPLSVELLIDGEVKVRHLYTERQVKALRMGAVQPLGDMNLSPGKHEVRAVVRGVDHLGQGRELIASEQVTKTSKPLITELSIVDREEQQMARIELNYW